jgi:hypothetical protein
VDGSNMMWMGMRCYNPVRNSPLTSLVQPELSFCSLTNSLLVSGIDVCGWRLWIEITHGNDHLSAPQIMAGYYVLALIILICNETDTFCSHVLALGLLF